MKALYCDVCKKAINNPISNRNYWHIGARDICEPCKDNMEIYVTAGQSTDDDIKWRMRIACCIPRATNARSECVTVIAFPLQQLLHEGALM